MVAIRNVIAIRKVSMGVMCPSFVIIIIGSRMHIIDVMVCRITFKLELQ